MPTIATSLSERSGGKSEHPVKLCNVEKPPDDILHRHCRLSRDVHNDHAAETMDCACIDLNQMHGCREHKM